MSNYLKIMTWNVHETLSALDYKPFSVSTTIHTADLVFMQEATSRSLELEQPQWHKINWWFEPGVVNEDDRMGLAILSRYPIANYQRHEFHNPCWTHVRAGKKIQSRSKGALVADIEHPSKNLRVACVHLLPPHIFNIGEGSHIAGEYVSKVALELWEAFGRIDILAGDFNNELRCKFFQTYGYSSATEGKITRTSGMSHDDVLVSSPASLLNAEIKPGLSDHHTVVVDVCLSSGEQNHQL